MSSRFACATFLAFMGFLVGGPSVEAFEVRPAILDLDIPAGSSTERELVIRNVDAKPLDVFFTIQKFLPEGGGQPRFLEPTDVEGVPSWVRLSRRELTLAPGEEQAVRVRIDVPAGTAAGGSYAGLFTTEKPEMSGLVGIGRRIASLLLVSVDGAKGPARMVLVKSMAIRTGSGGTFETIWKNEGLSHGIANLRLEARRLTVFGLRQSVKEESMRLLPQEQRTIRLDWEEQAPLAWVQVQAFLDGKRVEGASRSLVVVRPGLVIVVGGVLALSLFFLWRRGKWSQKGGLLG